MSYFWCENLLSLYHECNIKYGELRNNTYRVFSFSFLHFGGQLKKLCSQWVFWMIDLEFFWHLCSFLVFLLTCSFYYIRLQLYKTLHIYFILLLSIMKYLQCNIKLPMYLQWADGHLCRPSQIRLFSSVSTAQNVLRLDEYWESEFTVEFCAVRMPELCAWARWDDGL